MIKETIILTGISRSGKTTYAKHLEKTQGYKYISFDSFFNYKDDKLNTFYFEIIKKLAGNSEKIVLDGYFSNIDKYFKEFKKNVCKNVQSIIIVVSMPVGVKRKIEHYGKFENIIYTVIPYLEMFPKNVNYKKSKFIDTSNNTFKEVNINSVEELKQYLLKINKKVFKNYLDNLKYDKLYQDIEIINFEGYSKSKESWERVKDLINWRNKSVIVLGSNHGYFSFKIEEQGAEVLGLDCHKGVLETAKFINWLSGHSVEFEQWIGGDDIPKCDIILCLNVLHHFKDKFDLALSKMNCKQVIFEINTNQLPLVKKYFKIIKEIKSHRKNSPYSRSDTLGMYRVILLGERL